MMTIAKSFKLGPDKFMLEKGSVWSFPNRGHWATHEGDYRGNCSPYVIRNLLLRYTKPKERVLDAFVGSGTTLIEAKLTNRNAIGVDINEASVALCKERLQFEIDNDAKIDVQRGDARDLTFLEKNEIDFIFLHPPYADAIRYDESNPKDISNLDAPAFIKEMRKVAKEMNRVLKNHKYCAILIGDIRRNSYIQPISFQVMQVFLKQGFKLKEIIIKEQHNCKKTEYWKETAAKRNFLLIAHEYLFIFKKEEMKGVLKS